MLCIWWSSNAFELRDPGQTVTADYYKDQLSRVNQTNRLQGAMPTTKFLQDNARPHRKITQQKTEEFKWKV